jgi:5-methylcytosine-specific restriction protein A
MNLQRRISLKAHKRKTKGVVGPNGHRLCRWCNKEVSPPRRTFCSDECVHEWRMRSSTKYLRELVYVRDCGVCSACNTDTRRIKSAIEDERSRLYALYGKLWDDTPEWVQFLNDTKVTKKEAWKSLWQADHILEVKDGGGQSGLDNIQTLCLWCHKEKTKKMRKKASK